MGSLCSKADMSLACIGTFSVTFALQRGGVAVQQPDRGKVLAHSQAQKHLHNELAGAVCQHVVPAPLHRHAQVLQLAYACLGHAAALVLQCKTGCYSGN